MTVLAHVVNDEHTLFDRLVHPFTGLDHLAAMALVALSGVLLYVALRGRSAVTTSGTTTKVRMLGFSIAAALSLAASIVILVTV